MRHRRVYAMWSCAALLLVVSSAVAQNTEFEWQIPAPSNWLRCPSATISTPRESEYDVTLGLCRLQTFMRDITAGSVPHRSPEPFVVLVAPLPGEIHLLGATLGAEAAWTTGWETHVRFPSTESALGKIVATNWFDAIDLNLSPALHREHRLSIMEQVINEVRRASRNPSLILVAGGRACFDRVATRADVGADAVRLFAADLADAVRGAQRTTLSHPDFSR